MADLWYAVIVRDGTDALLYRRIRRNGKRETFVLFPPAQNWPDEIQAKAEKAGWAHATYHADGTVQLWNILGDRPLPPRKQQPLDASFHETEPFVSSPIAIAELHCKLNAKTLGSFTDAFEIASDKVTVTQPNASFQVTVDLAEPGCAEYPYGWTVIEQKTFKELEPWVVGLNLAKPKISAR